MRDYILAQKLHVRKIDEETFYEGHVTFGLPKEAVPLCKEAAQVDASYADTRMFDGRSEESLFAYGRTPLRTIMFEKSG